MADLDKGQEREGNQQAARSAAASPPSRLDSVLLEGQRLARATAGDLTALASLLTSLPRQLKDSVVHAVQELYGNSVAVEAAGQQQANDAPSYSAGVNVMAAPAPLDDLHRVMAYAGHRVTDRGGFIYAVCADGSFEIVHAPSASQKAMGRRITAGGAYGKAWLTLAELVPTTTANQKPDVAGGAAPPVAVATENTPAAPTAHAARDVPTDLAAGVAHFKTKAPTLEGETIDIAQTRAKLGVAGTAYSLSGMTKQDQSTFDAEMGADAGRLKEIDAAAKDKALPADARAALTTERQSVVADIASHKQSGTEKNTAYAADLASGSAKQDMFYCSGLSIWTLAAAGYDVTAQLVAADGQPYFGEVFADVMVDAKGKPTKKQKDSVGTARLAVDKKFVTLKKLLDGDPVAIEIMTRANGRTTGGSVGEIKGTGYQTESEGKDSHDVLPLAARGAAGAFALAGIGSEVNELVQKPGDFAQSRRTTTADGKSQGVDVKHRGYGHAWQVTETNVLGDAMFGQPGSPVPLTGKLEGWHRDVPFKITNETDPSKVGKHVVTHAKRVEAQSQDVVTDTAADSNKDGGVQLTKEYPVPDHGLAKYSGYVVYYGRLGESRWYGWEPAACPV